MSGSFKSFLDAAGDNTNHICHLNTADSDNRSKIEIKARKDQVELLSSLRQSNAPMRILSSAPETAARESRRILGDVIMTGEEYLSKHVYADAVSYTYWFIDIHRDHQPSEIIYLHDEKTPTISLGAMRPKGLTNVFVAGRCVSSDRSNHSAIRVKASCMAMGQAAGVAVVQAISQGTDQTRKINVRDVRKYLAQQGAIVPGM